MPTNLSQVATERGIKYFLISFVDLFGSLRSKLVPARAIADMQKDCLLYTSPSPRDRG